MKPATLLLALACAARPLAAQDRPAGGELVAVSTAPDGTALSIDPGFINPTTSQAFFFRAIYRFTPEMAQRLGADRRVVTQEVDCAWLQARNRGVTELSGDTVVRGPLALPPGNPWTPVAPADSADYRAMCDRLKERIAQARAQGTAIGPDVAMTGPELLNVAEVQRVVVREAEMLRLANVAGSVEVMVRVSDQGRVGPDDFAILTATRPEFARAAARVVQRMRFRPGTLDGRPVATWASFPINFAVAQ